MKASPSLKEENKGRLGLIGAIAAAVAASLCCLGPLILLALGVSGAWIGNLAAMEKYRPIFISVTLGLLGFAFYRVYRKSGEACEPGSHCASPKAGRFNEIALWIVTVLVLGLLATPYAVGYLSSGSRAAVQGSQIVAETRQVTLAVQNMTCAGCVPTVTSSLKGVEGILELRVTLEPPEAIIVYDPDKVDVEKMIIATSNAGYPSTMSNPKGIRDE